MESYRDISQLNVSKGLIARPRRRRAGRLFKDSAPLCRADARASDVNGGSIFRRRSFYGCTEIETT